MDTNSSDTEFVSLLKKTSKRAAIRQVGVKLRPAKSSIISSNDHHQITAKNLQPTNKSNKQAINANLKSNVYTEMITTCPMITSPETSIASNSNQHQQQVALIAPISSTKKYQKPRRRVATLAQRRAANIRERRRMFNLNAAFDRLRKKVPSFAYEKRLSRIETLKLAIMYIKFMDDLVNDDAYVEKYKQLTANTDSNANHSSAFLTSNSYLSLYGNARCINSPSPPAHIDCGGSNVVTAIHSTTNHNHHHHHQQQQQQQHSFSEKMLKNHQRHIITSSSPLINGQEGTQLISSGAQSFGGAQCSGNSLCPDSCCSGSSGHLYSRKTQALNSQQQSDQSPPSVASLACCSSPASSSTTNTTSTCNSSSSAYNDSSPDLTSPLTFSLTSAAAAAAAAAAATITTAPSTTNYYNQQTSNPSCIANASPIYANPTPTSSAYYCDSNNRVLYHNTEPQFNPSPVQRTASSRRSKHLALADEDSFVAQEIISNHNHHHQVDDLSYACQQTNPQDQLQHHLQQSQQPSASHQHYSLHSLQAR